MNVLKEVILEVVLPVSDFSGDFDRARVYVPTQHECRTAIKEYLEEAGLARRKSSDFRITKGPDFLEFDSTNPGHACGYYAFTALGPAVVVEELLKSEQ